MQQIERSRDSSLDALRGLAIMGMVLSGSIAFGDVLPAWMYHAQVPPPLHQFNPLLPGITWVDLVFPFFLFAMGAAFPLASRGAIDQQRPARYFVWVSAKRFFLLAFFALFSQHMKAWVIAPDPGVKEQLCSLMGFVLLMGIFLDLRNSSAARYERAIKVSSLSLAIALLAILPFRQGAGFDLYKSDIILMVLGNMAFFGSLLYHVTTTKPTLRLCILPLVAAVILTSREAGDSAVKQFFFFDRLAGYKFDWLYRFYFLKYLFIVVPGTLAGEWMMEASWSKTPALHLSTRLTYCVTFVLLLVGSLCLLLYRHHPIALEGAGIWVLLLACGSVLWWWAHGEQALGSQRHMVRAGLFFLLLGLLLEPYEGGIKKDPSTFSYYFVCSGFAFLVLPMLRMIVSSRGVDRAVGWLADVGKNPLLAYVAGSLLVLPVLSLTGLKPYWESLTHSPLQGFCKGLLFTAAIMLLTRYSVKKKWFWKT